MACSIAKALRVDNLPMNGCVLIWFFSLILLEVEKNFHGVNFWVVYVNLYSFFLFWSAVSLTETHQRTHTVQLHRRNWFLNVLSVLVGAWWEEWVGSCQHLPWVQAYFGKCASSFPAQTSKSRSVSYLKDFFLLAHLIMSNVHLSIFLISLSLSFCAYWHSK